MSDSIYFGGIHIVQSDLVDSKEYVEWEEPVWFINADTVWLKRVKMIDCVPNGFLIGNKMFVNAPLYKMILEETDGVHRQMGSVHTHSENWRLLGQQSFIRHLQSRPQ